MEELYKEITVQELQKWKQEGKEFQLLDVREMQERLICHIHGIHIPMHTIPSRIEEIPEDKPVVVYCHHGMRSLMIVKFMADEFKYKNLYNLIGGIDAWSKQIDPSVPTY